MGGSVGGSACLPDDKSASKLDHLADLWKAENTPPSVEHGNVGRNGALRQAKKDAGILRSQHPERINRVPLTDNNGKSIIGEDGRPIMTREYYYTNRDGKKIVIQDHGAGHNFGQGGIGDQGPHFNIRPIENTRTGTVSGTLKHYPFD
ncbi:HNH/endonuclease VII fold putative polymorphic toxin [Photobacterium damselae]|uniref:HNH/endonuclease VII fold putative polymorphic toxin n=1 Tax=Photobacterium damselae TaxID=38293 RepID=UPI0011D07CD2|nr:HNH/endonuclease VII fold putative polymorphic toxin [Photobacterium damselae]KAB1510306.1 hypothetical protein FD717_011535 [Photobacterium damselae subsp. damselae]